MKVLVACEFSGIVRDAFIALGHDAMSCDLEPTEREGPHYQGDVRDLIYSRHFDLMIAHPPCTYLRGNVAAISGAIRFNAMEDGANFFNELFYAPINMICVENPIPHSYAKDLIGPYSQITEPWRFGDDETKRVCLWLKNLPKLQSRASNIYWQAEGKIGKMSPSKNRAKERSRFFPGIARAMAEQWGKISV